MKSFLFGCVGTFIGLVLVVVLLVMLGVFNAPATPSGLTASPVAVTGQPDISITASTQYVNTQMQKAIGQTGLVKQATANFAPPNLIRIVAPINVALLGQTLAVNVNATMSVSVQNGRAILKMEQVEAGGFNVPSSVVSSQAEPLRAQAEQQINQLILRELQGSGLSLSNIRVTSDALTIDLVSR